jgi:psp operon transcriptional activator
MSEAAQNHTGATPREAIGASEAFLDFQQRLSRAAKVDRPVLIVGERGTGKELAAARLHYLSARWGEPLVALNCAALPSTLIESELFGYEPGAFTGAAKSRAGRFETANGGTLFLDEIGSIPLEAQVKILRVVEYQTFERLGGTRPIRVDVRIVGATNADLPRLVAEGVFKADLLDRLSFEVLQVPPLRERRGDVDLLARHFAVRMAHELGWSAVPQFSDRALAALNDHPWPGNVRELKNVVERAVYRSDDPEIDRVVFDPFAGFGSGPAAQAEDRRPAQAPEPRLEADPDRGPLPDQVRDLEIGLIRQALDRCRHNQRRAAEQLGLTYNQFRGLYRKYGF